MQPIEGARRGWRGTGNSMLRDRAGRNGAGERGAFAFAILPRITLGAFAVGAESEN
jgi:hypothetical protein